MKLKNVRVSSLGGSTWWCSIGASSLSEKVSLETLSQAIAFFSNNDFSNSVFGTSVCFSFDLYPCHSFLSISLFAFLVPIARFYKPV